MSVSSNDASFSNNISDHVQSFENLSEYEATASSPESDIDFGFNSDSSSDSDINDGVHQDDPYNGDGDTDDASTCAEEYSWRIDHDSGDYKLKAQDFIARTEATGFNGTQALDMLHNLYTINYGSRRAGSKKANINDVYITHFFLDYISIIGQPLKPITEWTDSFFAKVELSFKHWQAPYSGKHVQNLTFELEHRTFRLASAGSGETWFVVMHPIYQVVTNLPSSRREQIQQQQRSCQRSALRIHHAEALVLYIKNIFLEGDLLGEGIEPSWGLGGGTSRDIASDKWTTFQYLFMEKWGIFAEQHGSDPFWTENVPAFHAYGYGSNNKIDVDDKQLERLPREMRTRVQVNSDSDSGSDGDGEEHRPDLSLPHQTDLDAETRSSSQADYDALCGPDFKKLQTELEDKYNLDHIFSMSYAIAVNIHCVDASVPLPNPKEGPALCLLADRNAVAREYKRSSDYTFFPMAFHPAYGNFSSPRPPSFLSDNLLAVMKHNMTLQNQGADVLSFGHFQGYSNIKRSIRHGPDDLLVDKGFATAALTLPASATSGARTKKKQQQLLERVRGELTPNNPKSSKPFAREQQRIKAAIKEEHFAFRMEQIISVNVERLIRERRRFDIVLRPIFQLMRFFLMEKQCYIPLLRCFQPAIFPGIMWSWARVFELAIDEMRQRFDASGSKGLTMALSEGVAALDRLGSYCFTGLAKILIVSVLRPLGTMNGIQKGAWPYVNPSMLDLRDGVGEINVPRWPRRPLDNRPLFMHTSSLSYYYGPEVAASRFNQLWFQELGGSSIRAPPDAARFVDEVFRELWIPQMRDFISYQLQRQLGGSAEGSPSDAVETHRRAALETWMRDEHPFSDQSHKALKLHTTSNETVKTKRDFARELFEACAKKEEKARLEFSSLHSTWFCTLQAAIRHTDTGRVNKEQWVSGIIAAITYNRIEWFPGSHRARLTHKRAVHLVGATLHREALVARPGSLKRAAIEADLRLAETKKKRRCIEFHSVIPFTAIPALVKDGFAKQLAICKRGDEKILGHYQTVYNCLAEHIGDPLCDLMLMMVLTLCASSATPSVLPNTRNFAAGRKRDPGLFAANLITRMIWFLVPDAFLWEKKKGMVLSIPDMTMKIEHKGVSNRFLRELGWVQQVKGNRDSPRNDEVTLQAVEKLMGLRRELLALMNDADNFIRCIFHSYDIIWVERCSSIIQGAL